MAASASSQTRDTGPGPVPPSIATAQKVFVSNAGADSGLFPHPFSGNTERAYNQFYADVQAWGRYQVVPLPYDADIIFELQLTAPNGPSNADKKKGASDPLPMFRLSIIDCKTHFILWTLTHSIAEANLQKTHDRNFDEALASLILDLKKLAAKAPPGTP